MRTSFDFLSFMFVFLTVTVSFVASVIGVITNFDKIVVAIMRRLGVHAFPTAITIAVSIETHPEQWSATKHELRHPKIGAIWTANDAYGLHVETDFGKWTPNHIERRIIRNAVDWRINDYIRNRLMLSINEPRRVQP